MTTTLLALAFVMPSIETLIGLALLVAVLGFAYWLLARVVTTEPWATALNAIAIFVAVLLLLRTFTTLGI